MNITHATYGGVDCLEKIKSFVRGDKLILRASNEIIGDVQPGVVKWLKLEINGVSYDIREGDTFAYPKSTTDRLGIWYSNDQRNHPAVIKSLETLKIASEGKADIGRREERVYRIMAQAELVWPNREDIQIRKALQRHHLRRISDRILWIRPRYHDRSEGGRRGFYNLQPGRSPKGIQRNIDISICEKSPGSRGFFYSSSSSSYSTSKSSASWSFTSSHSTLPLAKKSTSSKNFCSSVSNSSACSSVSSAEYL